MANNIHLMMLMGRTTFHYFVLTFLFLYRFSSMNPQNLCIANGRVLMKPDFLKFCVWGAVKDRKTPSFITFLAIKMLRLFSFQYMKDNVNGHH